MMLEPGKRIGHYEITALLGRGGMGEVYRARDVRLGREVAVKVLHRDAVGNRDRLQRFLAEARTVAAVNHPNVLTLHDCGESDAGPYLVTELVEGATLRQKLAEGSLNTDTALELVLQVCDGLAQAHDAGIVHRDIKPENVMVTRDGIAKILDFGLAKLRRPESGAFELDSNPTLTAAGTIVGTPHYLAPEQLRGQPADARADVFGLGLLLYEVLSGSNPFQRESAIETMNAILKEEPTDLPRRPGVSGAVVQVMRRALAKQPAERFASAREMAAALRAAQGARVPSHRRLWMLAAAALGGAAVVVFLVAVFRDLARLPDEHTSPAPGAAVSFAVSYPENRLGVAILPIVDQTGDPEFAQAGIGRILADAFIQILVDFPNLYVIDRYRLESIARSLGRNVDDAARDNDLAREIGTRAQAQAMLSGSLSHLGNLYILNATMTDIGSGVVLQTFQAQSESATALLSELTGRVSDQLRAKFGTTTVARDVESVATASVQAYAHYVRGDDLILQGDWTAAAEELQRAVAIDPNMALAWANLACAYSFAGDGKQSRNAYAHALQLLHRLNDQERRWVELDGIWVNTEDGDLYLKAMQEYMRDYPDDHRSLLYVGLAWQYLKGDCAKAITWYEKAFSMTPNWYPVTNAWVDCLKESNVAAARRVLEQYLSLPLIPQHARQQATWRLEELARES